jgi:hypothetical protein
MTADASGAALRDAVLALAGCPDDASVVDVLLMQIVSLVAASVVPVDYASVTAERHGMATTVATSSDVALAVDEAQYAEDSGPCLDALREEAPAIAVMASTMTWPGFRAAAQRLGLAASFSIPLVAGSGHPAAALNLYTRDLQPLIPLMTAVAEVFARSAEQPLSGSDVRILVETLDDGSRQLVTGIADAFHVQQSIQIAIGILRQRHDASADRAYVMLREQAAGTSSTLLETAVEVVVKLAQD